MRLLKLLLILFVCNVVAACGDASIGRDCRPDSLINMAKEVISRTTFWNKALVEIDESVAHAQKAFNLSVVIAENDKIRRALDEREMRAAGITPESNPELKRIFAEVDRILAESNLTNLQSTLKWAETCRTYAQQKLSGR